MRGDVHVRFGGRERRNGIRETGSPRSVPTLLDKMERAEGSQAASLLYKIIDARGQQHSTALVTNIDFEAWGDYLGDVPLAMAFLDRLVDGAIILKIKGKSYRAHRAKQPPKSPKNADQ